MFLNFLRTEMNFTASSIGIGTDAATKALEYVIGRTGQPRPVVTIPLGENRITTTDFAPPDLPKIRGWSTRVHLASADGPSVGIETLAAIVPQADAVVLWCVPGTEPQWVDLLAQLGPAGSSIERRPLIVVSLDRPGETFDPTAAQLPPGYHLVPGAADEPTKAAFAAVKAALVQMLQQMKNPTPRHDERMAEELEAVAVPPLSYLLAAAEGRKGAPLDDDEVLEVAASAVFVKLPHQHATKLRTLLGPDIPLEALPQQWLRLRNDMDHNPPQANG